MFRYDKKITIFQEVVRVAVGKVKRDVTSLRRKAGESTRLSMITTHPMDPSPLTPAGLILTTPPDNGL